MKQYDLLEEDFEQEYFEDTFTIIVIYDIISNKRRTYFHKLLNSFGYNIQKSAFECFLTKKKYQILLKKINKFARKEDLIRVYCLNENVKTIIYGQKFDKVNADFYFI